MNPPLDRLSHDAIRALAKSRGRNDALGSLWHAVLRGETTLHDIAHSDGHGQVIMDALGDAVNEYKRHRDDHQPALDELRTRLQRMQGGRQ
jgi:hypothetical protein